MMEEILAQRHWKRSVLEQYRGLTREKAPKQSSKPLVFSEHVSTIGLPVTEREDCMTLKNVKRTGRPQKLNGSKLSWIYLTVVDKDPLQMKFSFAL